MVTKDHIRKLVEDHISGTGIFLVDVRLSSTGRITVLIVCLGIAGCGGGCASLSRFISNELGDEAEEHELNVSSPGLDMPLLVTEQYLKNEDREVEAVTNDGEKITGIMHNVTSGGFDLRVVRKQKGKEPETTVTSFNYEDLKSVKVKISFK